MPERAGERAPLVPPGLDPLALLGTTASGKSALALAVARARGDVELVSVDSMQVYRGMDIGTAKPTAAERAEVPHHVLDLVDPWESFDVARFQAAVRDALADIAARGRRALLVGGTGLYLRAVVDDLDIPGQYPEVAAELDAEPDTEALHARLAELDPTAAGRMEPSNRRRVLRALEVTLGSGRAFSSYGPGLEAYPPSAIGLLGVDLPREVVRARIAERYAAQLDAGFCDEIARLAAGPPLSHTAAQALGYRELWAHVVDGAELGPCLEEAINRTRQFARRQRVWFAKDPRITWFEAAADPTEVEGALLAEVERRWGPPT